MTVVYISMTYLTFWVTTSCIKFNANPIKLLVPNLWMCASENSRSFEDQDSDWWPWMLFWFFLCFKYLKWLPYIQSVHLHHQQPLDCYWKMEIFRLWYGPVATIHCAITADVLPSVVSMVVKDILAVSLSVCIALREYSIIIHGRGAQITQNSENPIF